MKRWEDHPHACGDKSRSADRVKIPRGSSPRVWGQEILNNLGYATAGIIPTRVGTRLRLFNLNNIKQDHPHACGDKRFTIFSVNSETGSSPRVWGQVLFFFVLLFTCGIIPTRVGTSNIKFNKNEPSKDHPHACGDK